MTPLNVTTDLSYQAGSLITSVSAADERGPLARAETSLVIDLANLIENPTQTIESLATLPWTIAVEVPPRRLGNLPPELRAYVPRELFPVLVSANGELSGGGFETQGTVTMNAEWTGRAIPPVCEGGVNTRLTATANLANGHTTISTHVFDGETEIGTIEMSGATPLDDWIAGTVEPVIPATRVSANMRDVLLESVPWACEYAQGPMTAVVEISELFTNQPLLHAEALTSSASLRGSAGLRGDLELDVDASGGRLLADLAWYTGERASFELVAPVTWNRETWAPVLDDGDVVVLAEFDSAPLGPFVTWLPQIAFAAGNLSGNFEGRGPLDDLDMRGALGISDGYVELVGLGQHLHDVSGDFEFNGNWARVHGLRAHDGDGSITVDGSVGFDGWVPARARIALNSRDFPVRSEGSILATLSGSAGIEAAISGEQTELDIEVRSLNVRLPDDSTRGVQHIEAHPDLRIIGVASHELPDDDPYPFRIHIDASQPFWVRRNDFAALVAADLVATYRDPDLTLSGYAELRRGFFEVFGKRFDIERGSMNFDGGEGIDPEVNLVAVHDMRSPPNTQVTIMVNGSLSSPQIEFSSNHRDCDDRAEIISMLVSGRCGTPGGNTSNLEFNAYEQASDFLAGIAAGLLTLTARKEFGDVLPVIVIESGNQAFQSARVRAGFQANDIIPNFLRGVVQGAYIEGIFTAGSSGNEDASLLPGVLIELSFPYSLVTTGEFTPPNNWSLDITYEP
jgi:translocation and assembly module TamB